jgi:hypothetical protein
VQITVQLDGQSVALDDCGWIKRRSCGCITAVTVAVAEGEGGWLLANTDQAHRHFTPRKDSRARETKNGVTVELITHAYYSEHIGSKWECDAHPCKPASA